MIYVQGMMAPIAIEKKAHYAEFAAKAAQVFKQHGALSVVECWGDDLPDGEINDMKTAVKLEPGETTLFSYVIWPSKSVRDEGMPSVFSNSLFSKDFDPGMDGRRMFFGGFKPIVSHGKPSGSANYIDGFLLAVPRTNQETYRQMAEEAWGFFEKYGAVSMFECWGDDVPDGKVTSPAIATQKTPDEDVLFSWVGWPSKDARDKGYETMFQDPDMKPPDQVPFDGSRMMYGGFELIVDL